MPLRLFANQIAVLAYLLSFLHGIILYWVSMSLFVYFQSIPEATPEESGINLFASVVPMVPGAIAGGVLIAVTGNYKPLLVAESVLMTVGMELLTMLDDHTNTVRWVVYQVVLPVGSGLFLIATLPAILATTATWGSPSQFWIHLESFYSRYDFPHRIQ